MEIVGIYSFNQGKEYIEQNYAALLPEVEQAVKAVDSSLHKTKVSAEKTMLQKVLYNPRTLNTAFKKAFAEQGWETHNRILCDYKTEFYVPNYQPKRESRGAYREMDFIKNKLGVEVQFGKYAFMVYNVCAKMTIFHKREFINAGIEIVPVKEFAVEMSTGVSYFEQFVWDLEQRGVSNIDIPVLILGIT